MYRRLIIYGLAVCASALVALVIPLVLAARDIVEAGQLTKASATARAVANQWQQGGGEHGERFIPLPDKDDGVTVTLFNPKGEIKGPNPPQAQRAVQAAFRGGTASDVVDGWGYVTTPAYFDDEFAVVLVALDPRELHEGLGGRLAAIGLVSATLLGIAAGTAWWLARRTVAPLEELVATANTVAAGDLSARAEPSSISEISEVAVALNRLTARVQELLLEEREYTAELAHQLRTPLTVLTADLDTVADPGIKERLQDDVTDVQRMVDEIIRTARRTTREGLQAHCDACAVVRERAAFWQVLAEDQRRDFTVDVPDEPLPVRLTGDDLAAALDILFQNVFLHTDEGTAFEVAVVPADDKVDVIVSDRGEGFDLGITEDHVGSTQLGLTIARRLAEASGGELLLANNGGAKVTLRLGPPLD